MPWGRFTTRFSKDPRLVKLGLQLGGEVVVDSTIRMAEIFEQQGIVKAAAPKRPIKAVSPKPAKAHKTPKPATVQAQVSSAPKAKSFFGFSVPKTKAVYVPKESFKPSPWLNKPIANSNSAYQVAHMSTRANALTLPSLPSLPNFGEYVVWAATGFSLAIGGVANYFWGEKSEATPPTDAADETADLPLKLGHTGSDADDYKELASKHFPSEYMTTEEQQQLEDLESAIEDVIHTGDLTFQVKDVIDGTEIIEPLTRHDDPNKFEQLRYNIDYFRQYVRDYSNLIAPENKAFRDHAMLTLVDKCARNGLYNFLEVLQNEFDCNELIEKHKLASKVLNHPDRDFIQNILTQQRVYYIRPESAQANVWLYLKMIRQQAIAKVKDEGLEEQALDALADGFTDADSGIAVGLSYLYQQLEATKKATKDAEERFKYIAVIDADKPEEQLDTYYETLKAESKRLGKPITGLCMLGAAHFTVNYVTVDANKKEVRHLYIDSFGSQRGVESDTTFYPSIVRAFDLDTDNPYKVESMLSKYATQRGSSMGCSIHACMYLGILLELGEWLGERYPALKKLPPEERVFTYCREMDIDGPVEARVSYRKREEIESGDYNTWHIRPRYIRYVKPPLAFLITGQSIEGTSTVNSETIIHYTSEGDNWNYACDPIESMRDVKEQHGVKAQIREHEEKGSPLLRELDAPFPHPGYKDDFNFHELLERFITRNKKGSERNLAIDLFVQDMREALVPYLLNASPEELSRIARQLDDPDAMFSASAMERRLAHDTTDQQEERREASRKELTATKIPPGPKTAKTISRSKMVIGHNHEASSLYDSTYGPELSSDAIEYCFQEYLKQDNTPGLLALLRRYPKELSQERFEAIILNHPNLGKLSYEITQLDSDNLPPQIANLIDTDMSNGGATFISSYDKKLIHEVSEQLRKTPKGHTQHLIVSRAHNEYWDAEADVYEARSLGDGNVSIIPVNESAREAVADPNIPTFEDMVEASSSSAGARKKLELPFFAQDDTVMPNENTGEDMSLKR